ncbi:peroxiredoxin [Pseudodesulfovibrio sp.]|uniref:peroxiredoxin n=1 Tax=unclassified Pseudodesulfovibrio TaxID=2661612 RepID=UPI003AFFBBA0
MRFVLLLFMMVALLPSAAWADHLHVYDTGKLKPVDSVLKVAEGDPAPDFDLPSFDGKRYRLSDFRGKAVVLTFVPAAWTPVCSDQWPGYNLVLDMFAKRGAQLIGISEDNWPSQHAWVEAMGGLGFPVLSDFWPHGAAASAYGVLRSNGMAERALFIIDAKGIIRWIHVGDINKRPDLGMLIQALDRVVGKAQ